MARFVPTDKRIFFFCCLTSLALLFSFWSPLGSFVATPKFWRDEAIPFEISRTFVELGSLDVVVAPGVVGGQPYLTHATGFPVTIPLAGVFKLFGVGVGQARLYMIAWIFAALFTVFFVARSFFGELNAMLASVLVATFTPFYANGRTMTGEIPGFFFLMLGLYFLYKRERPIVGGICMALAAVSKPSIYLLIFPVLFVEFLAYYKTHCIPRLVQVAIGMAPILLVWVFLIVPSPFSLAHWQGMVDLYRHPFDEESLFSRMPSAFVETIFHTTILYILFLVCVVIVGARNGVFVGEQLRFYRFSMLFGLAGAVYYLRSPGWLRYLLGFELLLLVLVPVALYTVLRRFRAAPVFIVGVLVFIHTINFFYFSDIRSSTSSIEIAAFLNNELAIHPGSTVGVIYDPPVAALIGPERKYQIATIGGRETYGANPLSLETATLPTYIVGYAEGYEKILERYYMPLPNKPGGRIIYKKQ